MNKLYGFVAPEITPDNYVFGALGGIPKKVLRPNGDWSDLPDKEIQQKQFETYNCTAFNTLSAIEKLVFVLTGEKVNYSDRFLGVVAGTKPPGNDPHKVAEAIRKYGCIPEEMMPFSSDLKNTDEYYSWKGVDKEKCLAEGKKWLERFNFLHEWVFLPGDPKADRIPKMVEALTMCPPSLAVFAWAKENGLYVDKGQAPNHWTGLVKDNPLKNWLINDSYVDDDTIKELDWDYNFEYCKRYYLEVKDPEIEKQKVNIISKMIQAATEAVKILLQIIGLKDTETPVKDTPPEPVKDTVKDTMSDKLLEEAKFWLGKDASPKNLAPQELSCAEGVSNIINRVIPSFPKDLLSTVDLHNQLKKSPYFKGTLTPKKGCVVVSPRTPSIAGHTGIFLTDNDIASNDSSKGKFEQNYTYSTWIKNIGRKRNLHTYLHEVVDN